jgi:hypothetical protein
LKSASLSGQALLTASIKTEPSRAQFAAVSEINNLFVGVARLILPPQLEHGIASFPTSNATSFSECCLHLWQRIRRRVTSAVENFIPNPPGSSYG